MENIIRFPHLRQMDLLEGLPPARADAFLQACNSRTFRTKTPFLVQGERPEGVFFVAQGAVEVTYNSPEGHRVILRLARTPSVLGLFEAIANQHCAAHCTALPGSELLYCSPQLLKEFLPDPIFIKNVCRIACKMLEHDNTYKAIDQFFTSEQKVCRYLSKFADDTQIFGQNQSYLANIVGCTRQTVNKELRQLREMSVIAIDNRQIRILDPEGLERRIKELDDKSRKRS